MKKLNYFFVSVLCLMSFGIIVAMEEESEASRGLSPQSNYVYLFIESVNQRDFSRASQLVRNDLVKYQPADMVRQVIWGGIKPGTPLSSQKAWDEWKKSQPFNPAAFKAFLLFSLQEEFSVSASAYAPMISDNYKQIVSLKNE